MIKLKTSLRKKMAKRNNSKSWCIFYCLDVFILYKRRDITI